MKRQRYLIAIATMLILASSQPLFAFLKAQGQDIVDSTGTPILLRGYGLGGWLVPEGYMLQTPGYGSPSSIRQMIVDLVGEANADDFYAAYEANYVNQQDINLIADWGFNSIRLPFHYKNFYDPATGLFRPEGFAMLDDLISWCKQRGLYLILDMHCAPGAQSASNISDSDGIARLWTEPATYWPQTVAIWEEIAMRYKDEPTIGGYDLINEPVLPDNVSSDELRALYIQIATAIRQHDNNHILFIEGNWYATNFASLTPPFDSNMAYSFHKYWSENDLGSIQGYIAMRNQFNVPLWMGESGENSNPWFYEAIQLFESNNIGWCWWTHKKFETTTSPYSAPITPGYRRLLDYWDGQAPQPSVQVAVAGLMEMAESLKLENCTYRSGVLMAMLDPTYGTTRKPFTQHIIPGSIDAVHYDHGNQGIGYFDRVYLNIGGSAWNSGWTYRNDGVDIEASTDPQSNGYNVGWIETGERLHYTVDVQANGLYRADLRVASLSGGGKIHILEDDVLIVSNVDVPSTGDWHTWTTMSIHDIPLQAGQRKITFLAAPGGYNFSKAVFFLTAVGIEDEDNTIQPGEFRLAQNYPNPFNPETTFEYEISKRGHVALTIHNLLGEIVATLVDDVQTPGVHRLNWHAGDLASGTYYYRLTAGERTETKQFILMK